MQSLEQAQTIQMRRKEINSPKIAVRQFEQLLKSQLDCLNSTNMMTELEALRERKLRDLYMQEKAGPLQGRGRGGDTMSRLEQELEVARWMGTSHQREAGKEMVASRDDEKQARYEEGTDQVPMEEASKVASVRELARQIEEAERVLQAQRRELARQTQGREVARQDQGREATRQDQGREAARQTQGREVARQDQGKAWQADIQEKDAQERVKTQQAQERELARQAEERELARQMKEREIARQAKERELARQAFERDMAKQAQEKELARQTRERELVQQAKERDMARQAQEKELARAARERELAKQTQEREEKERLEVEQRLLKEEVQKMEQRRKKEKVSQQLVLENARRGNVDQPASEGSDGPSRSLHNDRSGEVFLPKVSAGQGYEEQRAALLKPRNRKSIGYSGEFGKEGNITTQSWDEFLLQEYEHSMSEDKLVPSARRGNNADTSSSAAVPRPTTRTPGTDSPMLGEEISYDHLPVRDQPQLVRTDSHPPPAGVSRHMSTAKADRHPPNRAERHSDTETPPPTMSRKSSSNGSSSSSSQGPPPLQQAMSTVARHQPQLMSAAAMSSKLRKSTPELRVLSQAAPSHSTSSDPQPPVHVFHHTYTHSSTLTSKPKSQAKMATNAVKKNDQPAVQPSLPSKTSTTSITTSTPVANGRDIHSGRDSAVGTKASATRPVIEEGKFTAEVMEAMKAKHAILISGEDSPLTSYPRHAHRGSTTIVKRHTMHNPEGAKNHTTMHNPEGATNHTTSAQRRGSQPQVSGNPSQPSSRPKPAPTAMLSSLV